MKFKSYAKINLALNVLSRRDDGYHNLEMIVLPINLYDEIKITPTEQDTFVVCKTLGNKIKQEDNTCVKTVKFFNKLYDKNTNYKITINKNIPIGAGLGGGSSNGGALFKQLCMLNKIVPTEREIKKLAKDVGADVPFFVDCRPSKICGIGDEIFPINFRGQFDVLIVMPRKGVSTKEVYEKSDLIPMKKCNIDAVIRDLEKCNLEKIGIDTYNSLENISCSLNSDIETIIDFINDYNVEVCHMTGSGSAVFAISKNKALLKTISKDIKKKIKCKTYLTKTKK